MAVGISPSDILQRYDIFVTGKYAAGPASSPSSGWMTGTVPELHELAHDAEAAPTEEFLAKQRSMRTIVIIASIIVLCSLILAYVANYIWVSHSGPPVRETPFANVVREQEGRAVPPPHPDTARGPAPGGAASSDSLTLTVRASSIVWLSIVRDTGSPVEMLLEPQEKRTLRSRYRFIVTTGNAGGAAFQVNGKDIGALGKTGIVLHNIVITADGVKK